MFVITYLTESGYWAYALLDTAGCALYSRCGIEYEIIRAV